MSKAKFPKQCSAHYNELYTQRKENKITYNEMKESLCKSELWVKMDYYKLLPEEKTALKGKRMLFCNNDKELIENKIFYGSTQDYVYLKTHVGIGGYILIPSPHVMSDDIYTEKLEAVSWWETSVYGGWLHPLFLYLKICFKAI